MIESNPEWADEARIADLGEIIEYQASGFSPEELQEVIYSRHVNVLKKAMLYDKGQTVAEKSANSQHPVCNEPRMVALPRTKVARFKN